LLQQSQPIVVEKNNLKMINSTHGLFLYIIARAL